MQWIIEEAYAQIGKTPDVIVDWGDWGKEPMMTILGQSPREVVEKVLKLLAFS